MTPRISLSLVAAALFAVAPFARAQCPQPAPKFALPGAPITNYYSDFSLAAFDAGAGPQLYTAGRGANGATVMRWDGASWQAVFASSAYHDAPALGAGALGGAPILLAALQGTPGSHVYSFDGSAWTFVGGVGEGVRVLGVFDDGTGEAITVATGSAVLRWNGTSFVQLGGALPNYVSSLASFDDGTGVGLYVAGGNGFTSGAGACMRWNGSAWTPVGAPARTILALQTYDDGSGSALYAGLYNPPAGVSGLQRWNGASWIDVGAITSSVRALELADFGAGPRLALTGDGPLSSTPLLAGIALYDGANFTATTGGFDNTPNEIPHALAFVDDGATRRIYARGSFTTAGGNVCTGTAAWDGTQWSVPSALAQAENVYVTGARALGTWDDGVSEKLVTGGTFICSSGASVCGTAATWDGAAWTMLGSVGRAPGYWVNALLSATLAGNTYLYAGLDGVENTLAQIKRFDGVAWSVVPGLPRMSNQADVDALEVFDLGAGPRLIAGVSNQQPGVGPTVLQYDGTTWSAFSAPLNGRAHALAIYDDGAGPRLFVGGESLKALGMPSTSVMRWDGAVWTAVGGPIGSIVTSLTVFDDGNGPQLYAAGALGGAGGVTLTSSIARWNGTAWSALPSSATTFEGLVYALAVHDDGRGDALFVGGRFDTFSGVPATNLARFDGVSWEAVHGGTNETVTALQSFDDDNDGDHELFVAGGFSAAFGAAAPGFARIEGCPSFASFCAGDGSLADHTTPCPCGNNGATGHGCANSVVAAGALLAASGSPALDTLVLAASGMPSTTLGLYMQHDAQDDRAFHDGVLCASGNLIRLRTRAASAGASTFPSSSDTVTLSQRGQVAPGSGLTRFYAVWYRNASSTFCPPATANVTNGLRVAW
jgi:hypothetical protein